MIVRIGLDNRIYLVFADGYDAWDYAVKHKMELACFGGFENAVCIQSLWGM